MPLQAKTAITALGLGSTMALYGVFLWGGPIFFVGATSYFNISLYAIAGFLGGLLGFLARPAFRLIDAEPHRFYRWMAPLLLLLGLCALLATLWAESVLALIVAGLAIGLSASLFFVSWVNLISSFPLKTMQWVFISSLLLAAAFNSALVLFSQGLVISPTSIAIGVVAALTYCLSLRFDSAFEEKPLLSAATKKHYRKSLQELIIPLACATVLLLIVPAIHYVALEDDLDWHFRFALISCAQVFAGLILFVLIRVLKRTSLMASTFVGAAPVLILALFLFPFLGTEYGYALLFIGSTIYFIVTILMMMECIATASQNKVDPTVLFGLCGGVTLAVTYFGEQIMGSVIHSGIPRDMQMIATAFFLIYLLGLVYLFVQNRRNEKLRLDISEEPSPEFSHDQKTWEWSEASKEMRCLRHIQTAKGLSDRETEVLQKILSGKNVPAISEELYISQNTVRTHVKKIYRAVNVHSRKELFEYFAKLLETMGC